MLLFKMHNFLQNVHVVLLWMLLERHWSCQDVLLQYFKCILSNAFLVSRGKSGNALHEVLDAFPFLCDTLKDVKSGSSG